MFENIWGLWCKGSTRDCGSLSLSSSLSFPPIIFIVQNVFFALINYLLIKVKNMKIENITLDDIKNAFNKCKTKKEIIEFLDS